MNARVCPFCKLQAKSNTCTGCGHNVVATRHICTQCAGQTPASEANCIHCGVVYRSAMVWKVPVIISMFVAAFALSVALALA